MMRLAPKSRRAFTLVEMTLSLVIFSIVMLAGQSAILLAARGIPDGRGRSSALLAAVRPMDAIGSELTFATTILSATATDIVFTVPDRNSDGVAETIHYNWPGTAGDPLTRQINGGDSAAIAENVQEFSLGYDARSVTVSSMNSTTVNYHLTGVRCALRTGSDSSARLVTTIRILGEPQVAGP